MMKRRAILPKVSKLSLEPIQEIADTIEFWSSNSEDDVNFILDELKRKTRTFDRDNDLIIPAGSSLVNFLIGYALGVNGVKDFDIGIYKDGRYILERIEND